MSPFLYYPKPKTTKQLQRFLIQASSYRHLIPNFQSYKLVLLKSANPYPILPIIWTPILDATYNLLLSKLINIT